MEVTNVKNRVVGVDIGVAITNYAVVDLRGEIIAQDSFSTLDYPSIDNYLAVLCNRVLELVEANGGYEKAHQWHPTLYRSAAPPAENDR